MKWLAPLAIVVCAGCFVPTPIGPYVKTVERHGDYLAILRCTLVLDGDELHEDHCGWERVLITALPPPPPR